MTLRLVFLGLSILALVVILVLHKRVKGIQRRGATESTDPDSTSLDMSDKDAAKSWEGLSLEGMHRVNQEEVRRILTKLEEISIEAVTPSERAFLDRMVDAERRSES